jgi:hypothetical protein
MLCVGNGTSAGCLYLENRRLGRGGKSAVWMGTVPFPGVRRIFGESDGTVPEGSWMGTVPFPGVRRIFGGSDGTVPEGSWMGTVPFLGVLRIFGGSDGTVPEGSWMGTVPFLGVLRIFGGADGTVPEGCGWGQSLSWVCGGFSGSPMGQSPRGVDGDSPFLGCAEDFRGVRWDSPRGVWMGFGGFWGPVWDCAKANTLRFARIGGDVRGRLG